jgi:hypothetical protein
MTHSLLQPRYIVEQDYPNSPFLLGDILVVKHHPMYKDGEVFGLQDDDNVLNWITYAKYFPNIFRLLKWHEYKELDEMPRYGKILDDEAIRIIEWNYSKYIGLSGEVKDAKNYYGVVYPCLVTPASEEEYLNYLKSKQL